MQDGAREKDARFDYYDVNIIQSSIIKQEKYYSKNSSRFFFLLGARILAFFKNSGFRKKTRRGTPKGLEQARPKTPHTHTQTQHLEDEKGQI